MNATLPATCRPMPSRRVRRLTVLVFTAGLLVVTSTSLITLMVHDDSGELALRVLFLGGVLLTVYGAVRLALPAMQGLQTRHAGQLDERQHLRVSQALAASYRIVALLLLGLAGFLTIAPAVAARVV